MSGIIILGTSLSFDLYSTGWKQYYKSKSGRMVNMVDNYR